MRPDGLEAGGGGGAAVHGAQAELFQRIGGDVAVARATLQRLLDQPEGVGAGQPQLGELAAVFVEGIHEVAGLVSAGLLAGGDDVERFLGVLGDAGAQHLADGPHAVHRLVAERLLERQRLRGDAFEVGVGHVAECLLDGGQAVGHVAEAVAPGAGVDVAGDVAVLFGVGVAEPQLRGEGGAVAHRGQRRADAGGQRGTDAEVAEDATGCGLHVPEPGLDLVAGLARPAGAGPRAGLLDFALDLFELGVHLVAGLSERLA
jgi:hypothetical protein